MMADGEDVPGSRLDAAARSGGAPSGPNEPWVPPVNPWLIGVVVAMAACMEVLDTQHRQRGAVSGEPGRQHGREHLGVDFLPGFQRDRATHQRMVCRRIRAQAILHDLPHNLHGELGVVRSGAEPGSDHSVPRDARGGRRGCNPWRRRAWRTRFLRRSAAWRSCSTALRRSSHRPSARPWADGSRTTTPGDGSSSSICRSAL
jgi:hypothetical protein